MDTIDDSILNKNYYLICKNKQSEDSYYLTAHRWFSRDRNGDNMTFVNAHKFTNRWGQNWKIEKVNNGYIIKHVLTHYGQLDWKLGVTFHNGINRVILTPWTDTIWKIIKVEDGYRIKDSLSGLYLNCSSDNFRCNYSNYMTLTENSDSIWYLSEYDGNNDIDPYDSSYVYNKEETDF